MALLLLIAALICWLVAAFPGLIHVAVGEVDWMALGLEFFGLWVLLSGGQLLALVRRP